ncbi:HelD family protein [Actinoplanes siamensis]|uniref:DNA helicase n=1 Tax=Actinoplanes siamensis TaxID=1223317 RepID=A0A919NDY1_9ACTN|nr:UvrD-helicase domain-containing protein [Actinoplanes siamensis]GIF09371.1 DNA helicase [Actinoplanes siamensis]
MTADSTMAAEIATEQEYFDRAAGERERRRRAIADIPGATANKGAAQRAARYVEARLASMAGPLDQVAIGWIDTDLGERLYVGHELIRDEASRLLVTSWKSRTAAAYYKARPADPLGVRRKRVFRCTGNRVEGFVDAVFDDVPETSVDADGAWLPQLDDALLTELQASRAGELRSIIATIQAAQYEVIEAPLDQLTVIQGGPGTGKTAIALHRVSWLLYNHAELDAEDVLVVGPNSTFVRYIEDLLPDLGDDVTHLAIGDFRPDIRPRPQVRGRESENVAALKGDVRMAGLLAWALMQGVERPSAVKTWEARVNGRTYSFDGAGLVAAVDDALQAGTYQQARLRLCGWFRTAGSRNGAWADEQDPMTLTGQIMPEMTAAALVQRVLSRADELQGVSAGNFTAEDLRQMWREPRPSAQERWTLADMFLLDEAEELINGSPQRYRHIVVDEVQDLSPMQLRALARRSHGSMTVVGDIAQSTGLWSRDDWDDLLCHLPDRLPVGWHELRYGYRVPRQIHELAASLAPDVAPGVEPPQPVREADEEPFWCELDEQAFAEQLAKRVVHHLDDDLGVGVICPTSRRQAVEAALTDARIDWGDADRAELDADTTVVSPENAKGLEFDVTVVVDPTGILKNDDGNRGDRLLYVALTRATQRLDVIAFAPQPAGVTPENSPRRVEGGEQAEIAETPPTAVSVEPVTAADALQRQVVGLMVDDLMGRLSLIAPHLWQPVLDEVAARLGKTKSDTSSS